MNSGPALDAYLNALYEEAFAILEGLRDYVEQDIVDSEREEDSASRTLVIQEVTRATRRMADVMAWLLLRRALSAGEIDEDAAAAHRASKVDLEAVQQFQSPETDLEGLPIELRGLIDRSRRVHLTIARLSERGTKKRA